MSDNTENQTRQPDELSVLKDRARLMGIPFSPNIGVAALAAKIKAKMEGEEDTSEAEKTDDGETEKVNPLSTEAPRPKKETEQQMRMRLHQDAGRLIRCRITNMDPKKKDLPGEIITVANEYIGTFSKFVPFGEQTDAGYHIPHCIYENLVDRKYLDIRTVKGKNGVPVVKQRWVREFAIEVLPPLTQEELDKLAAAQRAAGVLHDEEAVSEDSM